MPGPSIAGSAGDLIGLLWDRDHDVRRRALLAAGRLRDPRFWPRIITHLSAPEFAGEAAAALISIGDPVLPELESIFVRVGQDSAQDLFAFRIQHREYRDPFAG